MPNYIVTDGQIDNYKTDNNRLRVYFEGRRGTLMSKDYGYFGKGSTGYAQYMTAFNRNFKNSNGKGGGHHKRNNDGCLIAIVSAGIILAIVLGFLK